MRVLLTGMSGTGKSALVEELRRRGHRAYDADDDGFGEPRADGRWGWRADRVADLLAQETDGPLFFAGCSEEQIELPFELRVLLTAPRGVLLERLRTRTSNPYGREPAEQAQVLADLDAVEPLLRRSADVILATTGPAPQVADRLLAWIAIRARADAPLAEMTTAEKAGQLSQYFFLGALEDPSVGGLPSEFQAVEAALGRGEVGSLLFVADPAEINRLQRLAVEGNRLGIPALFGYDVIHGLRTILPVPIAMAASWDPATIERGQAVAAREARAVGIHWAFAPMVDIARDPRWGRMVEGAGEDPFLGAAVAAAQVRGFQGDAIGAPERVIAGPKHFAGYGAALGGRDYDEVNLSDSELWNVYLPPFAAAVAAGAGNVMTAYMALNGIPATGNRRLFTDVLRDTLGFEGFVVSDANAVRNLVTHGFAADLTDAGVRAITAGVDMEMAMGVAAYAHLPEAVENH